MSWHKATHLPHTVFRRAEAAGVPYRYRRTAAKPYCDGAAMGATKRSSEKKEHARDLSTHWVRQIPGNPTHLHFRATARTRTPTSLEGTGKITPDPNGTKRVCWTPVNFGPCRIHLRGLPSQSALCVQREPLNSIQDKPSPGRETHHHSPRPPSTTTDPPRSGPLNPLAKGTRA